jgi:flagellar basal body-associated protein FliL
MEEEHSRILEEKKSDQKKAILITLVVVLVIALLVLAVILFLPERKTAPSASGNPANNTVSGVTNSSDTGSSANSDTSTTSAPVTSQPGNTSSTPSNSTDTSSNTTSNPEELVHKWVINNLGYTYVYGNIGLEQFNDTVATQDRFADTINSLYATLPENMKAYCIVVPTNVEFVDIPKEIYAADNFFNSSQKKSINAINEKLNSNIKAINIYDTMDAHKKEYLYFRTDINWTALAAYYAYNDFAAAAGFTPVLLTDFERSSYPEFLGRFYTASKEESLAKTPDSIEYFLTDKDNKCKVTAYLKGATYNSYKLVGNNVSSTANGYNVFLGIEAEHYKITTGAEGKGKLLIVSDTSAAAFVPYLVSNYSEIHYVNPNLYKGNISKLASDNGISEVLFMNYVTNANRKAYTTVLSQLSGVNQ